MAASSSSSSNHHNHRGRYVDPHMSYKSDFGTGNRLLTGNGYGMPDHVHGMNQQPQLYPHHHQFPASVPPRTFVPHYDNTNMNTVVQHNGGSIGRPQYQQRLNGWPATSIQHLHHHHHHHQQQHEQQQQHNVYTAYNNHHHLHQSFCGQNTESVVLQSDHSVGWTSRESPSTTTTTTAATTVQQSDDSKVYHVQEMAMQRERESYLIGSSNPNLSNMKRRLSIENSSTIYDQMPPTPYASEPSTPSFHSSYSSSSSTYLAPSPPSSSVNLTCPISSDPYSASRASIPLDHFPPTPYSEDLHSPNSEHSGYTRSSSSTSPPSVNVLTGNPFENDQDQLNCLDGYDSQRTSTSSADEVLQREHSSSFDAREVKLVSSFGSKSWLQQN